MSSERLSTAVKLPNFLVTLRTEMNGFAEGSAHGAKERRILPSDFIVYPQMTIKNGAATEPPIKRPGLLRSGPVACRLLAGDDSGPQSRDRFLDLVVIGRRGEELLHHVVGRVDDRVIQDFLVDELLGSLVAVGVEYKVAGLGDDLRLHDVVDELVRLGNMRSILRDRHHVEPHLGALRRDRVADLDAVLCLFRTAAGLEDVAGITEDEADV